MFGVHKFLIWSILPFTLYREDTLLASAFSHYAAYTGFRNHLIAEVFPSPEPGFPDVVLPHRLLSVASTLHMYRCMELRPLGPDGT